MKIIRKIELLVLGALLAIVMSDCRGVREKTAEELLANPDMENEIYSALLTDSLHLDKLMDRMMADENCRSRMSKHEGMIKMMCTSEKMDSMMNSDRSMMENMVNMMVHKMEADTATCSMMCSKVMENEHLKSYVKKHACAEEPNRK